MKIKDVIENWRDRHAAAQYDPRQERAEILDALVPVLAGLGYRIVGSKYGNEGPLGGESDMVRFERDTPAGRQSFMVSVYANGVYSKSQEEQLCR